jgi:hypothetical protein
MRLCASDDGPAHEAAVAATLNPPISFTPRTICLKIATQVDQHVFNMMPCAILLFVLSVCVFRVRVRSTARWSQVCRASSRAARGPPHSGQTGTGNRGGWAWQDASQSNPFRYDKPPLSPCPPTRFVSSLLCRSVALPRSGASRGRGCQHTARLCCMLLSPCVAFCWSLA